MFHFLSLGATTMWVVADARTSDGLNLIKNAMQYVVRYHELSTNFLAWFEMSDVQISTYDFRSSKRTLDWQSFFMEKQLKTV